MRWMLENVPSVASAMSEGRACFGTVDSWLLYVRSSLRVFFVLYLVIYACELLRANVYVVLF